MNISEFKKKNKPKKVSNLKKFEVEIIELHNDNYSLKSIAQFLNQNGIKTTFQNVACFIKSTDKKNIYMPDKNEKTNSKSIQKINSILPKLEKVGKDLDLKEAPDWAN